MQEIYILLNFKIQEFKSWKIFNLERIIDTKFKDFYLQINLILQKQNKLKQVIFNSKYKDFIDFEYFKEYLKKNFNAPIKDMISLLNQYEKMLSSQIKDLQKENKHITSTKMDITNREILDKTLEQKEFVLKKQLENLQNNKIKLENSLLK